VQRQFAMVFDLNKCLGCQTCTLACKTHWTGRSGMEHQWWVIVNSVPGLGTPRGWEQMGGGYSNGSCAPGRLPKREEFGHAWDFNYDRIFNAPDNQADHLRPANPDGSAPAWGPNWEEDIGAGEYPNSYFFYLPLICMNCANPVCRDACPRDAVYRRPEDGIVLIDEERCNGCRFCMEACPYKRIYFNSARGICQKCFMCFPRLEQGVAPACARQCPGRMVFTGYLDDPEGAPYKLVTKWKVALPLHPEYGTEPTVFYVPPAAPPPFDGQGNFDFSRPRIPREYLRSLFGPGVDAAIATLEAERARAKAGERSELMDTLIAYRFDDLFRPFTVNPAELKRPPGRQNRAG
jgi:ethylbenzene hydroxylase subunit beta/complex iron-sulfur molybdoenzyme family reductase subunit beta